MRRLSVTLLLLLALTLGLSAGPHPCHAAARPAVMASHASCHEQPSPKPAKSDHDCCDPVKGGHILCDQACQGAAVIGVAPTLPGVLSFQDLAAPVPDRLGSLFVPSIDHVPLT
ncbi:MAG: hypothetical protein JF614_29445 [Acidobacteria bacterium]|nr:hypothetical protein [Acidobacteriota bacterium]